VPAFGKRPATPKRWPTPPRRRPSETVARIMREQLEGTPYNYLIGQFAFGDLTLAQTQHSVQLFADHVMPAFATAGQEA